MRKLKPSPRLVSSAGFVATSKRDPIYEAIERHRKALAAYEAVPEAMEEGYEAVVEAQSDAYAALLTMQPTTKAGAHAALEYLIDLNWDEGLEQFAETVRASQVFVAADPHLNGEARV